MSGWMELGGAGFRRVIVLLAFLGVPLGVWWVAMPTIEGLNMSDDLRRLLYWSVAGTAAFGLASGFLVWRDLDKEP